MLPTSVTLSAAATATWPRAGPRPRRAFSIGSGYRRVCVPENSACSRTDGGMISVMDGRDELIDDELSPAELARLKRRERDLSAEERALMNSGSAKWFKQVLDRQARAAQEPPRKRRPKR